MVILGALSCCVIEASGSHETSSEPVVQVYDDVSRVGL